MFLRISLPLVKSHRRIFPEAGDQTFDTGRCLESVRAFGPSARWKASRLVSYLGRCETGSSTLQERLAPRPNTS